jgi:hypothetical protein
MKPRLEHEIGGKINAYNVMLNTAGRSSVPKQIEATTMPIAVSFL